MSSEPRPALKRRAPRRGKYDREKPAKIRREEQRTRLLLAAGEVLAQRGWAKTSVAAIVGRAGMSRRTFYEHFDDLDDVLLQLAVFGADQLYEEVQARTAACDDPLGKLDAAARAFLGAIAARGALTRVLFREFRGAGPRFEAQHRAIVERFAALLAEGIADAHARGVVSRPPDDVTTLALICGIEAVGVHYAQRGEEAHALEAAPRLVELVYRAFK